MKENLGVVMKRIILFFIIVFNVNFSVRLHCNHYNIIGDSVEFACKKISGIDKETFEIIGFFSDYAKDKNSVYYRGEIVRGADTDSIELAGRFYYKYAKDKKNVYYKGKLLNGADPNTFQELEGFYVKDKRNIYYQEKLMKEVDIDTFEMIKNSDYAKDKKFVYYHGEKVKKIDKNKLEVLAPNFLRDDKDFYYEGKELNVDMETFIYTIQAMCIKGEDKNKKYEYNCDIQGWSIGY